jgi:hypothetical protein
MEWFSPDEGQPGQPVEVFQISRSSKLPAFPVIVKYHKLQFINKW